MNLLCGLVIGLWGIWIGSWVLLGDFDLWGNGVSGGKDVGIYWGIGEWGLEGGEISLFYDRYIILWKVL